MCKMEDNNNTFGYWIIMMRVDEWIKRFIELNTLNETMNSPQFF
jgi:hypothetical protein